MHQGKRLTLLHLSDPQFGDKHAFARDSSKDSLANRLVASLARLRDEEDVRPDLVVISGDLAEHGMPSEFKEAETFIRTLYDSLSLDDIRRIVVVPGNHDINRRKSEGYFVSCEGDQTRPVVPYWPKYEPYAEFFRRLYGDHGDLKFTQSEPFTLYEYPKLGTVVAGLNSTMADSHRKEDHYGWVGEEQLRHFAERLRPFEDKGYLRIGVVHHDPRKFRKDDGLKDAELLKSILSRYLDVLLYGHTHADEPEYFGRPPAPAVLLLGIGSAGVVRDERPDELANQYQILRFSSTMLERWIMRYEPDRKEFIGDLRGDLEGKRWRVEYPMPSLSRATEAFAPASAEETTRHDEWVDVIEQYRERMARDHRRRHFAEQSGLLDDETSGDVDLLKLFVMPQLEKRQERRRPSQDESPKDVSPEATPSFPEDANRVIFDATQPWLVIVGGPGSGKSTLSNWLMLKLCVAGEELPDPSLAEFVPVRVDMRRFALGMRAHQGSEYSFFDYFRGEDEALVLDLFRSDRLRNLAEQGRLWWIFDGLDEVVDAKDRERCIVMMDDVRRSYRGRGLITSREMVSDDLMRRLSLLGIPRYAIIDLDSDRLSALLRRFPMPETRRERLFSSFARTPALREVCRVPLLATMVALLSRRKEIPERRRALYAEFIELLVDRWETAKGHDPADEALGRFDYRVKTKFLTSLAHRMMTQGGQENAIGEDELRKFTVAFCVEELGETELVARKTAKQLLSRLRDRHGVLVYWGAATYGFVHRSFLDALAAEEFYERYFRGKGQDELAERVRTSWSSHTWRECLVLALGGIAEKRPAEALRILQEALRSVRFYEADFSLFAAFCIRVLSESGNALERDPLHTFALRLTELIRICGVGDFRRDDDGQRISELLLSFRDVGARWPGADALRAWALDEDTLRHTFWDNNVARIAIATTPPAEHPSFLKELLERHDKSHAHEFALLESCIWRKWSDDEIHRHVTAAMAADEKLALRLTYVFLFNGYSFALNSLIELMCAARESSVRLQAAAHILDISRMRTWTDSQVRALRMRALKASIDIIERKANRSTQYDFVAQSAFAMISDRTEDEILTKKLSEWSNGGFDYRSDFAAMVLAWRGNPTAIGALKAMARLTEYEHARLGITALLQIADHQPLAHNAVRELLMDAHSLNINAADSLLNWATRHLAPDVVKTSFTRVFESTNQFNLKLSVATKLRAVPELESVGTSMLLVLTRSSPDAETRNIVVNSLCSAIPSIGEATLNELLAICNVPTLQPSTRFSLAFALIRPTLHDPQLRQTGEDVFVDLVAPEMNAGVRLSAAIGLRRLGNQLGQTILRELAQSTTIEERTRQFAARELHDLATLRILADTAESEQIRNEARQFLAMIDARRAILRVGRLRRAIVSLAGERVGILEETPNNGSRFTYDAAWLEHPRAKPIAPSLPLRPIPYESEGLHPFFENLLPEGWLLQIARKTLGVSGQDVFGLLLATCRDCIGAVEIIPVRDEDDA